MVSGSEEREESKRGVQEAGSLWLGFGVHLRIESKVENSLEPGSTFHDLSRPSKDEPCRDRSRGLDV